MAGAAGLPAHQPPVGLAQQLVGGRGRGVDRLVPVDGEGHPGQQVGGVEPAGQGGRLPEQPHGLLAGAGEEERLAELEGELDLAGRVVDHLEGPPQVPGRLLGGQAGGGVAGRRLQELDPPGRPELGPGEVGVAGQAGRDQPLGQPRVPVHGPDHGRVPAAPFRLAERVVEGLPDQVVGEREPAGAGGDDQPGADRPAEQPVQPGRGQRRGGGQDLGVELLAEHGRHAQQLRHRLGEQGQAPAHGVADAGRDRGHRAVGVPQLRRLLDEEGVPAGAPVDLGDQLRVGLATRGAGDQGAHLVPAQAGQGHRGRLGHQLEQERGQGVLGRLDLDVAVGADQQQPLEPGVLGGELQQPQRRRVGPVQVVEHDHHRAVLGDRDQGAGHRVEDPERLGRVGTGPARAVRRAGRRLAQQHPQAGAAGGLGRRPLPGGGGPPEPADHLHPRPVAGRAVRAPAGAAEDQRPPPPRLVGGPADQGGLADPGLPGDQHQPAVAVGRPGDLGPEHPGRMVPPDDRLATLGAHATQCSGSRWICHPAAAGQRR